jgi:hypothetical protein
MTDWRTLHKAALLETDTNALEHLVFTTEDAIFQRLQELAQLPDSEGELLDLKAAAADLLALKTQKLGWPNPLAENSKQEPLPN